MGNSACWRYGREDNIDELKKLLDPEPLFEENQWYLKVVSNNESNPTSSGFEDIYGYYNALGEHIRRIYSDQAIHGVYAKNIIEYRNYCLEFHTDNNVVYENKARPIGSKLQ